MKSTKITHGIEVSVEPEYQEQYSNPKMEKYVFTYQVAITNLEQVPMQLRRRQWYIKDAAGFYREVEGAGVIGEQPILRAGDTHTYSSWSETHAPIGKMYGFYTFERLVDGVSVEVTIPEFMLIVPFVHN